ncbi:MAG: alpha-L-arabinofuranosidase [Bacteroidales bacterium]|nr:alpha-L-arabinofuranosidase [Bacteroidales bacterium]
MKKLMMLSFCVILYGLFSGVLLSQEPAVIKIDPDRKIGAIDQNIYGSFLESPRRGLYEPDSKFADENGFRKDLIALIRELNVPVIRWPGGNFVSGYNWEDGIGPKDKRPARLDIAWNRIETNQLGTDEYVKFCKLIGAENFVCINAGTGTLDDARHWVEYCNYPKGTYYSDLRIKYGNDQPFKVKYWALGNELDGPWQLGHKIKEDYVKFANEAAKLMQLVDKDIKIVASGSSNYPLVTSDYDPKDGWIDWNDYLLDRMVGNIDYISIHRYATQALRGLQDQQSFANQMSLGAEIDKLIKITKGLIEKAMEKSGSKRPVYISFDEYSARGNSLTGSLMLAQHLNSFIRNADVVKMANLTFLTSLAGISPDGVYKNTLFYPFYLYSRNCLGTSLDVLTICEKYSTPLYKDIPYLDVSASLNESKKTIVLNVINKHETKAISTDIILQSGEYTGSAKAHEINGETINSTNTPAKEEVKIVTREIKFKGNSIRYIFPAHSLTQFEIALK